MDKKKIKSLCRQYEDKELSVNKFTDALEKEGVPFWVGHIICDLHRQVSFLSNFNKLTEEEKVIALKWQEERKEQDAFFKKLGDAEDAGSNQEFQELLSNLPDIPHQCEHGRHIFTDCMACDHIEKTLYPDMEEEDIEETDE